MGVTVMVCPATVDIQTMLSRCRKKAPGLEVRVEKARDKAELESRLRAFSGSSRRTASCCAGPRDTASACG